MPVFEKPRENRDIENGGQYHLPCVVLIDTSGSMSPSMEELKNGVNLLVSEIQNDEVASGRVELTIITYDDTVKVISPFGPADGYEIPYYDCGGTTHMHDAVAVALDQIEQRKNEYKAQGTPYYRPWIFMLTDGQPNDNDNGAFQRLLEAQRNKKTTFFGIGIGNDADIDLLKSLNVDNFCFSAGATSFKGVFKWLSSSLSVTSKSNPGDGIDLDSPAKFGQIKIES